MLTLRTWFGRFTFYIQMFVLNAEANIHIIVRKSTVRLKYYSVMGNNHPFFTPKGIFFYPGSYTLICAAPTQNSIFQPINNLRTLQKSG